MFRIALCDTNAADMKSLQEKLEQLAVQMHLEITVDCFRSAKTLYDAAKEKPFSLVFLETEIGGVRGIDLARRIRFHNEETAVIFVSAKEEYALAAYAVFPVGYLLKPVSRAKLHDPVSYALGKRKSANRLFLTTLDGGKIKIDLEELLYVEVFGNELDFHCKREIVRTLGALSSMEEILPKTEFYRSHRNFIVNLRYVQKIERYYFGMQNGEMVAVAKNRFTEARAVFEKYLSE